MHVFLEDGYVPADGRRVLIGGKQFRHCACEACGRDFVEDPDTGEQYAVNVSGFGFERLVDEVNDRWLNGPFPKTQIAGDQDDRLKR